MGRNKRGIKAVLGAVLMAQVTCLQAGAGYLSQSTQNDAKPVQLASADDTVDSSYDVKPSASASASVPSGTSGGGKASRAGIQKQDSDMQAQAAAKEANDSSMDPMTSDDGVGNGPSIQESNLGQAAAASSGSSAATAAGAGAGTSAAGSEAAEQGSESSDNTQSGSKQLKGHAYRNQQPDAKKTASLVIGGICLLAGGILAIWGFTNNPSPNGSTTISFDSFEGLGGSYYAINFSGVYTNSGNCGVYATIWPYLSGHAGGASTPIVLPNAIPANLFGTETSDWSGTTYGYLYGGSWSYSATTTQISDGSYAPNSALVGILGTTLAVGGLFAVIGGLTPTRSALSENGVDLKLAQSNDGTLLMACSKSF